MQAVDLDHHLIPDFVLGFMLFILIAFYCPKKSFKKI